MATALVIGASGFVGRALVSTLRARGWNVRGTARSRLDGCELLDVCDANAVAKAVGGCEAVFNLAASKARAMTELADAVRVNTQGTANVVAACARSRGSRPALVSVGTAEEYGRSGELPYREDGPAVPISAYGASKLAATHLVLAAAVEIPSVVVRPSIAYGPHQPREQLVMSVALAAIAGRVCTLNGGAQTRDLVFVNDLADAIAIAAERAHGAARGALINVSSGLERRVDAIADRVVEIAGVGRIERGPASTRPGDTDRIVLDPARARALLGWTSRTSLDDGIRQTLDSLRGRVEAAVVT